MVRRRPPGTEEGWYVLHDLRHIDWDAWRDAADGVRERALEEGIDYLESHEALADADAGGSAVFSIVGHKADLLVLHLRPTLEHLDRAERRFESTALADFTERASSYVSVTEVSGYMHEDLDEGLEAVEDEGLRNYMQQRIYPDIPDMDHVCFYPMDKRRGPSDNWYDLPFEERAEYMSAHGDIGREYAGKVTQIITGSVGLDDHEWGVTLFADDPTDIKHLLYEMRFDPSSSRFAEFGTFYVGRRFAPADLGAVFAGEAVPTDQPLPGDAPESETARGTGDEAVNQSADSDGRPDTSASHAEIDAETLVRRASSYGVDPAETDAGYGLLFESDADESRLVEEVEGLRENFDHYDTHVETAVRSDDRGTVVVSLWRNERAANTASGFLGDLPGASSGVGADLGTDDADADDGSADVAAATGGGPPTDGDVAHEDIDSEGFQRRVHRFGIRLDEHPEAGYALLFRSDTEAEDLVDEVDGLRENFDHYDTHVLTTVRADSGDTAVISLWANERAATTASGFLADLSGVGPGVGADFGDADDDNDPEDAGDAGEAGDASAGDADPHGTGEDDDIRGELEDLDIYAGQPHGEDVYAMVLYSEADPEALRASFEDLRERFREYDSHVKSEIYADEHGGRSAVVSVWERQQAADRAGEALADLPGIVARAGEESGFGTMGMFYTVKPEHREDFVETFEEVGEVLGEMDGHMETRLLVNESNENDMFISSQWRDREDAMTFFRSEAFRDTVQWGREILDDRPRHVFLA